MKQLRLLPLQAGETVEQKVASFRSYDDEVSNFSPCTPRFYNGHNFTVKTVQYLWLCLTKDTKTLLKMGKVGGFHFMDIVFSVDKTLFS